MFRLSTGLKNAVMDGGWDGAWTDPVIEVRDGTQPNDPDSADTGNLLGLITLPTTDYFSAAADGVISANGSWSGEAYSTGTPTWFRMMEAADIGTYSTTAIRLDGSLGGPGSLADIELDNATITASDTLAFTSFDIVTSGQVLGVDGSGTTA
jgi:hypothetical protein